jgi:hypothetical protein
VPTAAGAALVQAKTALADTTGSVFLQKCTAATTEARWNDLIKLLQAHLDLVFSKCNDKSEGARDVLQRLDVEWTCCT